MAGPLTKSRTALHDVPDETKVETRSDKALASSPEHIGNVLQQRTPSKRRRKDFRDFGGNYEIENIARASRASAFTYAERMLDSLKA
jgi:hypothetical protein